MAQYLSMPDPCEHVSRLQLTGAKIRGNGNELDALLNHIADCRGDVVTNTPADEPGIHEEPTTFDFVEWLGLERGAGEQDHCESCGQLHYGRHYCKATGE